MNNCNQFESIVKHLLEVEESTEDLINSLTSSSEERMDLLKFINKYIQCVEEILRKKDQISYEQFSPVIVGCRVKVEEVESGDLLEYKIVLPFSKNYEAGDVSCISPVGKQILLKKIGDEFTVSVPLGTIRYRIISISYENK